MPLEKSLFLKILTEGSIDLYFYREDSKDVFVIKKGALVDILESNEKRVLGKDEKVLIKTSNRYKGQL